MDKSGNNNFICGFIVKSDDIERINGNFVCLVAKFFTNRTGKVARSHIRNCFQKFYGMNNGSYLQFNT